MIRPGAGGMVFVLMISGVVRSADAAELKAGVARVDLTPPMDMKAALGGYGARMSEPAEGVHDRIFAKALVLSDGAKRFALVTADVLAFPPPFKPALMRALGEEWSSEQVMLLPSHSHTSIDMTALNPKNVLKIPQLGMFHKDVYDLTLGNLVQVIRQAGEKLVPVRVGTSRDILKGWNRNRRKGNTFSDRDLTITRVDTTDGKPLAVLVNWTAHPTFMDDPDMMFSGGWPGHLQRQMEALIGQGVTVMYYNGAQGDQSPVARRDSGKSNWEKAERYGRALGIVAWRQWRKTEVAPSAMLDYDLKRVMLPERCWHPDFMETGGSEYGLSEDLMKTMLNVFMAPASGVSFLRLGDLLIIGIPGEMAARLGADLKAQVGKQTGLKYPVIGGLANEWISYILSAEEYEKGGYESSVSFYGPKLAKTLTDTAVKGLAKLDVPK